MMNTVLSQKKFKGQVDFLERLKIFRGGIYVIGQIG